MKKFNWGHGITLFYIIFVGVLATALIASFGVDHSLVVDDYYAQDLAYQSTYNKAYNANKHEQYELDIDQKNNQILLDFKNKTAVNGTIEFYRASDKSQDFVVDINSGLTRIATNDMIGGKWTIKIEWKSEGTEFYKEETIYL